MSGSVVLSSQALVNHQRSYRCHWSRLLPEAMLMFKFCALTNHHTWGRELAPPLTGRAVLTWAKQKSWPWWCGCRRAGGLANLASTQAQIQGPELAHTNIYPMYELLECVKGLVLKTQRRRISLTRGYNRIAKRSPSEKPILIV